MTTVGLYIKSSKSWEKNQFSLKIHKVFELKMDALVAVNIIQDVYIMLLNV